MTKKQKSDLMDLYDAHSEDYSNEFQTPAGRHFMGRKIKTALKLASFEPGASILEIGCANGPYTVEFG